MTAPAEPTAPPSLLAALRFWAWLGCASFGGPAAQIARLHDELVVHRRWLDGERFDHALDFCTMLPGPEAQQLATWCGFRLHGVRGGIAAGALFVLPGAVLMALLSWASAAHADRALALHALWGAKAVVAGLVAVAVVQLARRVVRRRAAAGIALAAFAALALGAPFPLVVPAAATLGLLALPATAGERTAHAPADAAPGGRPARVLAVGAGLWLLPWLLLLAGGEAFALLRQLYLFFSVAALVTFGGAYAVLAYVADASVHTHGWLTTAQALDGIALAEATPGPLVLALQHVAFVAAWNQPGASPPLAMALLAAAIAAWTTFLPGMTFVLAGAPLLERLRARPRARAALAGVTGAALGALLQLALGVLAATLRPAATGFDGVATGIAGLAFVAVASRRLGVLAAMALGVAAGLLRAAMA
ncbi:MAG: chromate efflux transporter [Planctomycetota bacterium]